MNNQGKLLLPEHYLDKFAAEVLSPLNKSESVSCMFVAGGGKRTIFNHILLNEMLLKSFFTPNFDKKILVYVEPDNILNVSSGAYLQLMYDALAKELKEHEIDFKDVKIFGSSLEDLKALVEYLTELSYFIIFILHDFEFTLSLSQNIYLNLESIMSIDKSKISYLFLSTINILDDKVLEKLHNLKYAASRNVVYFPLLTKEAGIYIINRLALKLNLVISQEIKNLLYTMCGGHPQLLKYSLYLLKEEFKGKIEGTKQVERFIMLHYQLRIICADIWNFLSENERNILKSIVTFRNLNKTSLAEIDYLLKLNLVQSTTKVNLYKMFGTLFEGFVKNKLPKHQLIYDSDTNKLYYGELSCEDKFTFQEFKLLVYFMNHNNQLISRDQVAEAIWGKHYLDKYSDWSIDKAISILRKKLDALGFPSENLVTLKKRGFSFDLPTK